MADQITHDGDRSAERTAHRAAADAGAEAALSRRHRKVGIICASIAATMVGASFAAVPLYRLFCQVTGFGGTTMVASKPSTTVLERQVTVRFDANTRGNLGWRFEPVQTTVDVKLGDNALAFYRATNISDRPVTGTAVFNVTPELAGQYFNKIECFCFKEQTLQPGESIDMPVSFFVDAAYDRDRDVGHMGEITLSYSFYPVGKPDGKQTSSDAGARAPQADGRGAGG